jgi:hypothetical protein
VQCRPSFFFGSRCAPRVETQRVETICSVADEWTMSQTQQQPDESSQDELQSINGSQIRHGPLRVALVETINLLNPRKTVQSSSKAVGVAPQSLPRLSSCVQLVGTSTWLSTGPNPLSQQEACWAGAVCTASCGLRVGQRRRL